MATSETLKLESLVKDITRCPICLDYCVDPRSLPCLHTFCLECMEGHCRDKCPEDDAECPVCRREFQIPESGAKGLLRNFFVADLVSIGKVTSTMQDRAETERCGVCADETGNKAKVYCVECHEKLCDHCSIRCRKWKGGAHQLNYLCEENRDETTQRACWLHCQQHSNEKLEKYCMECNVNICLMCIIDHDSHEVIEISHAAVEIKKQVEEHIVTLSNIVITLGMKKKSIEEANENNFTYATVVPVNHRSGKESLTAYRPADKSDKDILTSLESIDLGLVALESFINYATELVNKGTCFDITRAANSLDTRANELLNMATHFFDENSPTKNRTKHGGFIKYLRNIFVRPSAETSETASVAERNESTCEDVYEVTRPSYSVVTDVHTKEAELSSEVNPPSCVCDCDARMLYSNSTFTGVRGVTYCDNKLFVVCKKSDTMFVSELGSRLFSPVRIEGLLDPCDIVACSDTKQLFIGDCEGRGIWHVSNDGQIKHWMSTTPTVPQSLSTTSCHILLTSFWTNELFLYDFQSNFIRRMYLRRRDLREIYHAVETSDGTFIVSHMKPRPQVSEVNVDGQVIRAYVSAKHAPHYLSLDSDGRVLVAEIENWLILLLNRDLRLERVVLDGTKHALVRPLKLCYVAQTGLLIVRDVECIEVFDIRQIMLCSHR